MSGSIIIFIIHGFIDMHKHVKQDNANSKIAWLALGRINMQMKQNTGEA